MRLIITAIIVNFAGLGAVGYIAKSLPIERFALLILACGLLSGAAFTAGMWFGRFPQ